MSDTNTPTTPTTGAPGKTDFTGIVNALQMLSQAIGQNGKSLDKIASALGIVPTPSVPFDMLRVNAAATAYELRTPAQVASDLGLVPPSAGVALDMVRINAAGTSYEARTPAQVVSDLGLLSTFYSPSYIDNSGFTVNQRGYTSGTALGAGGYGFDRWKGGPASGGTLTFTASPASTIVNITAGSIQQFIEGINLLSKTYTLSWTGTATGRIANSSGGGSYAASPVQFSATAGTNAFVEFTGGTLGEVQLSIGTATVAWQPRRTEEELALCQRFYTTGNFQIQMIATAANQFPAVTQQFPTTMRGSPVVNLTFTTQTNGTGALGGATINGYLPFITSAAAGLCVITGTYTASADP